MRDKVIIIGAILVLGAGFALWRMTQDISSVDADPSKSKRTQPAPAEATDEPAAATPASPANRDARIPPPMAVPSRAPTHSASGGSPSLDTGSGSGSGSAAPVSHARMVELEIKRQLVRQIDGLEGAVSDCMAKTKGAKLTGASAVTLKIERVQDQAVVTEVAVEPIDTTIKDTALNNCLATTGKKIVIDLPEGVTEITATHQVNIETGSVTGHDLTAFEFKPWGRPVDPPAPPK